ncbi:uncharacterized protein F4822DRAFT_444436 [Hypoxylon trugodes]|uniref:uncharacterized protein n=1 Tax=Hypoxylon trugodes TaxID=326681 RepID=UPI00218EC702|nr:uncharacterized protein F4822DRAFT_444436 [Hypoxylon trugodes]KAI1387927.1 hypothetical protein F4822DRAFT_444436 [Hypoxylon trugodes]
MTDPPRKRPKYEHCSSQQAQGALGIQAADDARIAIQRDFHASNNHYHECIFNSNPPSQTPTPDADKNQRRKVLESLKFTQIDSRRQNIKVAHAKTCRWFLETSEYRDWLDSTKFSDHGGFLWIKGKPGAGKSTLMKFSFSQASGSKKKQSNIVISFFFNARGDELEKSTVGLYRSLLLQLFKARSDLQHLLDSFGSNNEWNTRSLEDLFLDVLQNIRSSLVCFVDALDECEEDQIRAILSFLLNASEQAASFGTKLRVCFASRHYPHITIAKGLNLVIEGREDHRQDIANYLTTELRIGEDRLAEQIRSELQEKASGVFMWVVLVANILSKEFDRGRKHCLREKLCDIPSDLHDLFHDILTRNDDNCPGLLLCIQWVLFARRPLIPIELYFAIISETEPDSLSSYHSEQEISIDDVRRYVLDSSKGLAESTISDVPTVQFIHESVQDFLLKENGIQKIWPQLEYNLDGQSHEKLKRCCYSYLGSNVVLSLNVTAIPLREGSESLQDNVKKTYPFLEYATENILYHANKAEHEEVNQENILRAFPLQKWIEWHNVFEEKKIRRYNPKTTISYIWAGLNLPDLIRNYTPDDACFCIEEGRYGTPLFAALATKSNKAVQALLQKVVQYLPSEPHLRDLCARSGDKVDGFKRRFKFKRKYSLASHIIEGGYFEILEILQKTNGVVFRPVDDFRQLLTAAAKAGNKNAAELILEHGTTAENPAAMEAAIRNDHEPIVKLLIARGADPKKEQYLLDAIRYSKEPIVELLIDSGVDPKNDLYLETAIRRRRASIVKLLIAKGIDPKKAPHLQTAICAEDRSIVELLLDKGADVNRYISNQSPLYNAACTGNEPIVRLLLNRGAHINESNSLCGAVINGRENITRLLLEKGASVGPGASGSNPLTLAAAGRFTSIARILLDRGACVEGDGKPETPLWAAVGERAKSIESECISMVRLLLERGANPNCRAIYYNCSFHTPLMIAVHKGYVDVVSALLKASARTDVWKPYNSWDHFFGSVIILKHIKDRIQVRLLSY